jgi:hypothetical protein
MIAVVLAVVELEEVVVELDDDDELDEIDESLSTSF